MSDSVFYIQINCSLSHIHTVDLSQSYNGTVWALGTTCCIALGCHVAHVVEAMFNVTMA